MFVLREIKETPSKERDLGSSPRPFTYCTLGGIPRPPWDSVPPSQQCAQTGLGGFRGLSNSDLLWRVHTHEPTWAFKHTKVPVSSSVPPWHTQRNKASCQDGPQENEEAQDGWSLGQTGPLGRGGNSGSLFGVQLCSMYQNVRCTALEPSDSPSRSPSY